MQTGVLDSLLRAFTAYLFPVSATKCLLYMMKRKESESKRTGKQRQEAVELYKEC